MIIYLLSRVLIDVIPAKYELKWEIHWTMSYCCGCDWWFVTIILFEVNDCMASSIKAIYAPEKWENVSEAPLP
ncbi:MAG: hypothetical protein WA738_03660 [Candidatus Angelobacter sp.]